MEWNGRGGDLREKEVVKGFGGWFYEGFRAKVDVVCGGTYAKVRHVDGLDGSHG